ncbi:LysR substrate-binding domain-containing protein [Phytopseudomonas dryadis]|uniref:LysR family transcriptional regulator n=1 Tax=Phytopseudomonas dryadis TaxID=2487520 RepID=A0A4Q9QWB8_9GAMM|nr:MULTISPECIES: LysR substrate-binding domain-containing protein [Pseudomonas]TBU87337.1 LysR family transcriptional regulator [Pseudomonas dryadis]TBV09419.1 LysR family transcriptional regulator [Pseudomonas dryadis]TBV18807.1 LysR family transcriptional regulator [Pseudomonas sp. FRB 230]
MKTTLDELLAFTCVVSSGSITAAAQQLAQTASGVSRALSRLEEKLDVTLLRRTTRRLELTEEGEAFLLQAQRILAAVEDAEEQMRLRRQTPAGRLRVNAAAPFMLHAVVPLVAGFRERYPQIQLELHSSDQIIDLLEQRTDLAIRIGPLRDSTLHARPLGSNRLRVLASPAYLAAHGTPECAEALRQHSLLGFTQPESLNEWPLRHALGDRWTIEPSLQASSGETLRQLALAGAGIVCLADFMTHVDRVRGDLVQVLAHETVDVRQPIHAVYYRNTALASRITCFLDYLSSQLGATD